MKVVKPVPITPAMLYSSDATELYSEWSGATTYALGDRVIVATTKSIWESTNGTGNLNQTPSASSTFWVSVGPMNKWAMFDDQVSTQSTATGSLTVVLAPGYINSLALFGLEGSSITITEREGVAGPVVYSHTRPLDGTLITDWYQYFFEPSVQLAEVVLTDLPPFLSGYVTVTITGTSVKVGHLLVGTFYSIGGTQYGATASITDYSRKDTDANGATTFVKKNYSSRMSASMSVPNVQINKVKRVLVELRATPCAWIGVDESGYEPLTVYGYYRDFSIEVVYFSNSLCSLEVEGLT